MSQQSFSFDAPHPALHLIPLHQNLIEATCDLVLDRHAAQLPDLSMVSILLPDNSAIPFCRDVILRKAQSRGYDAVLGPHITSFKNWLNEQVLVNTRVINNYARELLLVDALQQHAHIYSHGNPWQLSDSLLELFDELTLWHVELPDSIDDFVARLVEAYGATEAVHGTLGREALLVHTLWYALHNQLQEMGYIDHLTAELVKMGDSINQLPPHQQLYYCGIHLPTPAENQWRNELLDREQIQLIAHDITNLSATSESSAYIQCLDCIFAHERNGLKQRAITCREQFPQSPIEPVISIYSASDAEDEALAVDIQVRQWLLQGKKAIGIVTENRKLARRVRALLERADITVEDNAGWPLSTTSAATVLERWLQTVEEDFHYRPLLDCLKSPFFMDDSEDFRRIVYMLEQHIIIDENTPGNIERYLKHIELRRNKLPTAMDTGNYDALRELIETIANAADPLSALIRQDNVPATQFLEALMESLTRLNVIDTFRNDEAGIQLLAEIDQLKTAARVAPMNFQWTGFRSWLGLALERFNFKIHHHESTVKLLTLNNSEFYSFDALILAGAEQEFLPRFAKQSPFFNDNVRATLNIPTQQQNQSLYYYYFRRLLLAVPYDEPQTHTILITRRVRDNDEDIIPSPWVAALQSFHQLAYGNDLCNRQLGILTNHPATRVQHDQAPLPRPVTAPPKPSTPAALLPRSLSASAYQQLIDCPYQFFAARCLRLTPPDTVKEALQKSDYGEKIHQCLEAFHSNLPNLPGPFPEIITPQNRNRAETLLNDIANVVFSREVEDNFMHRGWLKRWQAVIPLYIDWQIKQQQRTSPHATEIKIKQAKLSGGININGRIDRLDTADEELAIIDYKTGAIPAIDDITSGEAIQLPFYLLLLLTATVDDAISALLNKASNIQALYVDVGGTNKVQAKSTVEADQLQELTEANKQRLLEIMAQMKQGKSLPAWGDEQTCQYCPMDGLCRKQTWEN
ncbi:MAG: PD-(D/E)XK nuclease family protein [Gammaproteobacteria bacterium]|jgi:ATP-dependent helicase/nuclease subunit B